MKQALRGSLRLVMVACGILAIMWAIPSIAINRGADALTAAANDVLHGETFSQEQLNQLRRLIEMTPVNSLRPAALRDVATIRLRLIEESLVFNKVPSAVDLDEFEKSLAAAIAANPSNSLLWLMECRLEELRNRDLDRALTYLGMSYVTGPNEGWIAIRREPFALVNFSQLPPALAAQVLSEFKRLVESGFYLDAANIIAGPGWNVREKLLTELVPVRESARRAFAKILDSKDLVDVRVPGIQKRYPF